MKTQREHWLDRPESIRFLWRAFIAVLTLSVLAEFFIPLHPVFPVEHLFGFSAAYGFLACALMVLGAKALGLLIKRSDTYYTKKEGVDD